MKKIATSHTAFFRLFFLCLLLMASTIQLWANAGDIYGFTIAISYSDVSDYRYTDPSSEIDLGTLTEDFVIKEAYLKVWDDWGSNKKWEGGQMCSSMDGWASTFYHNPGGWYMTDKSGNNYELQNSAVNWTISDIDGFSGVYHMQYYWQIWGNGDNKYLNNGESNYKFKWAISPPNATAITATPTGAISGDGSELDPYIVPYGGDLTIALSGSTKERSDANSEVQYSTDGGSTYGTSGSYISKTLSNVTATTLQNYVFKARCYNSTASLESPSITTKTVYYKAARGVPVYKFVTKSSDLGTDPVCAANNTDYPLTTSDALTTLIGGTLTARADDASKNHITYNTSNLKFSGTKSWLILGLENKIKAGDVIRYINSGTSKASVAIQTTKGTSTNQIELYGNESTTIQTLVITDEQATAFASANTVYMLRNSGNSLISYFEILRPYTVTLDANTNGGTVEGENTITFNKANDDDPFVLPHADKSGYKFKGWYTTSDGNTKASNPYTATASTTLYAQWEDCPSSGSVYKFQVGTDLTNGRVTSNNVAFEFNVGNYLSDLEGGTLGTEGSKAGSIQIADENSISIGDGAAYLKIDLDCATEVGDTIKTIVTTKTAYLHHSATSEATMTIATSANTSTYQKQVIPAALEDKSTLYLFRGSGTCKVLYFEIIRPVKYTITYNAGTYGTGSIDAGTKIYNGDFTLSSSTFSRDNYIQDGWATSDGGSKVYDLGGTYSTNADITLYPHWAHSVTYHSATEDDYSITVQHGADIDDTYIPSNCAAAYRVFVGWATSEVSTQQTAPTIVSTDGKLDDVSSNMDLYAVFASRNGGKVTGSHKLTEDFESYKASTKYEKKGLTFDNANGLLWQIDYGNVTATQAERFGIWNTRNVLLSINNSTFNKLMTKSIVKDVLGISVLAGKAKTTIKGVMYWGSDTTSWDNNRELVITYTYGSYKTTQTFSTPQNIYVRFSSLALTTISSGDHLYLDSIVFTIADRAYYLTDYSTTCTKAASATVTWVGGEGAEYDEPSAPALGDWVTLPEITRPNYQFDGWKATIEGDEKSHTYNAGESFLVNHNVTFTAQWTRYIEDIAGVSPITTGNGIAVRSYEVDSIVVNSETATTPTVNKVGTDASMFIVTIDAANKRVADGKTHFPYYVTYTPTSHNITSTVNISFTCDDVESSAITVQGRSLPEEFVIAVKKGDGTWVALPNTIVDNSKAITPIEIAVDNTTTPTEATFAPNSTVYKTDTRYAVGANVYGIRFTDGVLKESKYNHLQVSSSSGTNYVWLSYTGSSTCQDWLLQSEDMSVYKLKVPTSGAGDKKFGLYSSNIGYYSSPSNSDIYLLPIENKAEQYEATVTTWAQSHIEVTLTEALEYDADEVIAKLGETSYDATAITGDGTQYGLTFEGIDLAGKNGEKLLLTWKKNGNVIGWSTISIPRIVAQSAEQDTWSKINPKASDIVVLNYPATVGTLKGVAKEVVLADGGQLVISANKALVVSGKITREDGSPTTAADLVIKSTSSGNGTLIFENDGNEATVEMYSIASAAAKPWSWQYMAVPFISTNPLSSYYGSYMYEWPSDCSTWQPVTRNTTLTAFTGYLISNPSANYTYSMEGELAPTEDDVVIDVPAGKEMVVGNSWTGPIQITQMTTEDFDKVTATIYLFNTGMDSEEQGAATPDAGDRYAPGTYVTIPINEAEDVGVTKISSLQGFYVEQNKTEYAGQDGSLTLSYSKHVRPTGANTVDNGPMHAPKRVNAEERPTLLKIKVSGSRYDDRLILLEREDFSTGFDNGWDGKKLDEPGAQPMLYTTRPDGTTDAVSALPEMDGTVISFHPGEDNTYTLRFEYAEDNDELYIVDTQTTPMQTTRVLSGNTYTFNTSNNDTPARFLLTRSNAPQITTANESPSLQGRSGEALKLILNQQLYIYRNGILYDATGRRVDNFSVGSGFDANANANAKQEKGGAE